MAARRAVKVMKKVADKVNHRPFIKTYIKAGQAVAAPPLGPQLGQVIPLVTRNSAGRAGNIYVRNGSAWHWCQSLTDCQ